MIWRCPWCRGGLEGRDAEITCRSCSARYPVIAGIPDLRVPGRTWVDYERDRLEARALARDASGLSLEALVRRVFASQPASDERRVALRTRQVLEAPGRLRGDVVGWLDACTRGLFLDLGCGPGMLLAAAATEGRRGIGVDVSMVWLVVARRLIAEWGGEAVLAGGSAEALPLASGAVTGVVSLDVIEHVGDPGRYLGEIDRVTAPGGHLAASTPNRYSLAAEPHVSVWGVGWLPRSLQKRYVRWRSGASYQYTRLLSAAEIQHLLRYYTRFRFHIVIPLVPQEEMAHFPPHRLCLARLYNHVVRSGRVDAVLRRVGPFFRIVGEKTATAAAGPGETEAGARR